MIKTNMIPVSSPSDSNLCILKITELSLQQLVTIQFDLHRRNYKLHKFYINSILHVYCFAIYHSLNLYVQLHKKYIKYI